VSILNIAAAAVLSLIVLVLLVSSTSVAAAGAAGRIRRGRKGWSTRTGSSMSSRLMDMAIKSTAWIRKGEKDVRNDCPLITRHSTSSSVKIELHVYYVKTMPPC
jgi:hypothetical protein